MLEVLLGPCLWIWLTCEIWVGCNSPCSSVWLSSGGQTTGCRKASGCWNVTRCVATNRNGGCMLGGGTGWKRILPSGRRNKLKKTLHGMMAFSRKTMMGHGRRWTERMGAKMFWERELPQPVKVSHVTLMEPVESRNVKHVMPSTDALVTRMRYMGVCVTRIHIIHSDRAKELLARKFRSWVWRGWSVGDFWRNWWRKP